MCGICGKLNYSLQRGVNPALIDSMMETIKHRGPDGRGKFVSGPVGLGHTRLSIIDLNTGAQPICNEDETIWVVFNGEIYNFGELRKDLASKGHVFRTHTDTEVIVHAYEEYGVSCLALFKGMFAFALWDGNRRVLFCARDRVGIKPLYYADTGQSLVFGSEIKAILQDEEVARGVDLEAVDRFLTFTYIPGDATLLKSVRKLEPGHYLLVENGRVTRKQYWDLKFGEPTVGLSLDDAAEDLRSLIKRTVKAHMVSDVPVGVLLSGGVDSTAILSCAAGESQGRTKTFTIGFDNEDFADERPFAEMAANRFNTEHHAVTIKAQQFADFLGDYIWHMEEPVYEPSAVALHYVSKLASQFVKVVLSGEGGDEAFGGYQTYRNLLLLEGIKDLLGARVSRGLSKPLYALGRLSGSSRLNKYAPLLGAELPSYYYSRRSSPFAFFPRNRQQFYSASLFEASLRAPVEQFLQPLFAKVRKQNRLDQMLYVDTKTWLPDDLLVKADKMTMANSIELRVPLLDHEVLEFAARLPPEFKVRGSGTKRILKRAFRAEIPTAILNRSKMGFPVPVRRWFQGDLQEYLRDHLLSERALSRGYFQPQAVKALVSRSARGEPVQQELFSLLALELWHKRFVDSAPAPQEPEAAVSG